MTILIKLAISRLVFEVLSRRKPSKIYPTVTENIGLPETELWQNCRTWILRVLRISLGERFSNENENFYFVSEFDQKAFGISAKLFLQRCQNCILPVLVNILRVYFQKRHKLTFIFWKLHKLISDFEQKFLTMLSKQHSTCPEEHYGFNKKRDRVPSI